MGYGKSYGLEWINLITMKIFSDETRHMNLSKPTKMWKHINPY